MFCGFNYGILYRINVNYFVCKCTYHQGFFFIPGDRILEVDSVDLTGYTHKQAVEALCNAPPFCKLLIERTQSPTPSTVERSTLENMDRSGSFKIQYRDPDIEFTPEDIYSSFVTEGQC